MQQAAERKCAYIVPTPSKSARVDVVETPAEAVNLHIAAILQCLRHRLIAVSSCVRSSHMTVCTLSRMLY